jgi:hypothetical protein
MNIFYFMWKLFIIIDELFHYNFRDIIIKFIILSIILLIIRKIPVIKDVNVISMRHLSYITNRFNELFLVPIIFESCIIF